MIFDAATPDLLNWIQSGGVVGILAFLIISHWKGWIVTKGQHDELRARLKLSEEQNAKWMELAFKATSISEQATRIIEDR